MRFRQMIVSALAFWILAILLPTSASANGFQIHFERLVAGSMVSELFISDNDVLHDENLSEGEISTFGSVDLGGGVSFDITEAFTKPMWPLSGNTNVIAQLLSSITVSSLNAATVRVTTVDTGYGGAAKFLNSTVSGTATAGSTMSAQSWASAVGSDASIGPLTLGQSSSAVFEPAGEYSLTTQAMIYFTGAGMIVFNHDTNVTQSGALFEQPTPEPGSLLLIGTGVLGLVARAKRRRFPPTQVS